MAGRVGILYVENDSEQEKEDEAREDEIKEE